MLTAQAGLTHRLVQTGSLYCSDLISGSLLPILIDLGGPFLTPSQLLWAHDNLCRLLLQMICLADVHAQACSAGIQLLQRAPGGERKESGDSSYLFDLAEVEHDTEDDSHKHQLSVDDVQLSRFQLRGYHAKQRGNGCWHRLPFLFVC